MADEKKIRVVLIGGSGYAGFEAIRLLLRHRSADLVGVFGPEGELGPMEQFYPLLAGMDVPPQELFDIGRVESLKPDVAMLCVPHKVAMSYVPKLRKLSIRCIDWSADYRISDAAVYEKWYCPHTDADGLAEAVYGLPEYFTDKIRSAGLVANPGCYPTCATLVLAPLVSRGLVEPDGICVNAISGVSGAGRAPQPAFHFPEQNENFKPYGVGNHRHMPEMEQVIGEIAGKKVELLFQPHLCPMDRGMLCSIYAKPTGKTSTEKLIDALNDEYANKPFVRVLNSDNLPATKHIATTNFCDVTARLAKGRIVLFSALDNLIKGASGQAIQNMNIMFGLDETEGLY